MVNGRARTIGIAEGTEARVREAMAELGYRPNLAARSLRLQKTKTIGFLVKKANGVGFGLKCVT